MYTTDFSENAVGVCVSDNELDKLCSIFNLKIVIHRQIDAQWLMLVGSQYLARTAVG